MFTASEKGSGYVAAWDLQTHVGSLGSLLLKVTLQIVRGSDSKRLSPSPVGPMASEFVTCPTEF